MKLAAKLTNAYIFSTMIVAMNLGKISPFLLIALGVSLGLFGFFLILANPFGWKLNLPSLIPQTTTTTRTGEKLPQGVVQAPTPYLFLPHGKQTYNIQGGEEKVAKISNVIYDPLDPKKDTVQTITATSVSKEPVSSISLTMFTDNQTKVYPMTFVSGTKLKGVWTTSFTVSDSYEETYKVSFEIISDLGNKATQPMPLR
ncbi:MAG: hypothetical protein UV06_C0009G0004 [Candidatus Collierbacteria bacterium GW2011_GWA2_42_17]|uniref:Uncharacterized protein n=1 Tax=Candidatus Collierbacteria bacterium GW2011_GWA2_42_17 TaxID=1618378 RepID=A0A0G0Z1G2_9BACT|nr:MAG: hypothetical protein UV06_C0009G0004 [Candidatus Collierbacteria bacterium GW2011_GWA2_42_17]